jgi:hypothetical protein
MTVIMGHKINANEAMDLCDQAILHLDRLNGTEAIDPKQGRNASAANAVTSKELLYIAHLCRKAETAVMDQYHSFKGESDHFTI